MSFQATTVAAVTLIFASAAPLHVWNVPTVGSDLPLRIEARPGEVVVIVGANGAGKSELGTWLDRHGGALTHRVSAHRQLWFASPGSGLTAQRYDQLANVTGIWRMQADARYLDHVGADGTNIVLFDLLGSSRFEVRAGVL